MAGDPPLGRPSKWQECDTLVHDLGALEAQMVALEIAAALPSADLGMLRKIVGEAADAVAAAVAKAAADNDPSFGATRAKLDRARKALSPHRGGPEPAGQA